MSPRAPVGAPALSERSALVDTLMPVETPAVVGPIVMPDNVRETLAAGATLPEEMVITIEEAVGAAL